MEFVIGNLFIHVLMGVICAVVASSRERSPVGWFILGFFLHCFGILLVSLLPDLGAERTKFEKLRSENRRLRERVKKDRQVSDHRQVELNRRLEAHDQALGMDTSHRAPALEGGGPPPPALPDASARWLSADWYYVLDGEAKGPIDFAELRLVLDEGLISNRSLVWFEGLEEWQPMGEVPGLARELYG